MVEYTPCWRCNDSGRNSNACTCNQYTSHKAKLIETKVVPYSDYATLAAAARRLVEAVYRREMSYETAAFVEDYYEVLAASKEQVEAATEWNAALAEVEALLKEKTK